MIPQRSAADARNLRFRRQPLAARRVLVSTQPGERRARKLGILLRHLAYQFEKERQGARRALMLGRTMLR